MNLMAAVEKNVADGIIIFTDKWHGYKTDVQQDVIYKHYTVIHNHNFVNLNNACHVQSVVRLWSVHKWPNK